jgi:hypothetical protein
MEVKHMCLYKLKLKEWSNSVLVAAGNQASAVDTLLDSNYLEVDEECKKLCIEYVGEVLV